ncbi:MAG: MaoC/PaaZ C-terminal domain-containing protein [Gammaproteobacteria bacterium]|nr:MaoC/PaaZ C-terminal domain-containing protein [Gammaproteobacteria bacterium]
MADKIVIDGLDGFRKLEGQTLGTSEPVEITQKRIEDFCTAVDNDEWIHWDIERCKNSQFGTTIAPGFLSPSLFPKLFFDMVDIRNVGTMLFSGSDRVRLLSPMKCGSKMMQNVKIDHVEERDNGIAVYYDVTWNVVGQDKPVGVAMFIIRYMD